MTYHEKTTFAFQSHGIIKWKCHSLSTLRKYCIHFEQICNRDLHSVIICWDLNILTFVFSFSVSKARNIPQGLLQENTNDVYYKFFM